MKEVKFTQEVKDKWLEALRSGEFEQHRGSACDLTMTKHCCIDVLRVVLGIPVEFHQSEVQPQKGFFYDGANDLWNAEMIGDIESDALITLNDSEGKSFSEIADYIEKNIPAVEA